MRENIAAFGGDPDNVTVFGESAGAMSIGILLAMPRAEGLFRRAILQSGAAHHVTPAADALRIGGYLADRLGVPPDRRRSRPSGVDRSARGAGGAEAGPDEEPGPGPLGRGGGGEHHAWAPTVDGMVVPSPPIERIAAGSGGDVDVIVGTNTDDWRLWLVASGAIGQITDEILTGPVDDYGYQSLAAYGLDGKDALAAYRTRYPDLGPGDLLATVQTDWWMRLPALLLADGQVRAGARGRTYMYEFAWPHPGSGAVHALEVPFVFDIARPDVPLFGGLLGPSRRRSWPGRCTPHGSRSPRPGTPDGRPTTWTAGPRCGST